MNFESIERTNPQYVRIRYDLNSYKQFSLKCVIVITCT